MIKPVLTQEQICDKYAGRKVRVYFNLHTLKWSVQDWKTRLVLCHADRVTLKNVTSFVSEAGRKRVLETKRKNVHAFIIGIIPSKSESQDLCEKAGLGMPITYNPYRYDSFVYKGIESKFESADMVILTAREVWVYRLGRAA